MKIEVIAPAKINLMLDVTGKRDDGYHTLVTIMQSVSLADKVYISLDGSDGISVMTDNSGIPSGADNIAYKAAEKFFEYTNIQHKSINIRIEKNIPSEAGLGGGSADAAAVLVGLNHLFDTKLSVESLCEIGVAVGADVPFCIAGGTKLCRGIGEIMDDVFPLENCFIVIAKGSVGISTGEAFRKIDALGYERKYLIEKYNGYVESVRSVGINIFEQVADEQEIVMLKNEMMKMKADYSAMSGSGSAVFGLFHDRKDAEKCAELLNENHFWAKVCSPVQYGAVIIS